MVQNPSTLAMEPKAKWGGTTAYRLQSEPSRLSTAWANANNSIGTDGMTSAQGSQFFNPMDFSSSVVSCVVVAHNVDYGPNWNLDKFDVNQAYGTGSGAACKATDLGCWTRKAFDGVNDTFKAVGMAIVDSIAAFFVPDTAQIQTAYDSFKTFMNAKLGFLTYPFTFLNNLMNAFNDTSNNWCTSSSCSINAGSFMGSNSSIDLLALQKAAPTVWNYLLAAVRGLTILALLIAVRRKFMETMHK